ncbi:MAG: membrane protein insertase YidC, partial [Dokdonella sp.]
MNNPRSFLLLALLLLGYLLWAQWQQDYNQPAPLVAADTANPPTIPSTSAIDASVPAAGEVPKASTSTSATSSAVPPAVDAIANPASNTAATTPSSQFITVTTDVLRVEIDPHGGSIVVADLLAYPQQPKNPIPVRLLDNGSVDYFVAQSGLVSASGAAPDHSAVFTAERYDYRLADGANTVEVPLTWQDASGISVRKILVFTRGSYLVEQRQQIANASQVAWSGNAYRQLQREPLIIDGSGFKGYTNTERYSFIGAAWYTPQDKFQKLGFDKFAKEPLHLAAQGGWVGMIQHYFFAAWIPLPEETDQYSSAVIPAGSSNHYLVRSVGPTISIPPGGTITSSAGLYVGPKLQSTLDTIAPGLSLTANYGIFTFIAQPLHWVLAKLHALTGNWGFAIILLVLLIKAIFFKLSEAQYRSMARMRKMQPRMAALKERFGDDRTKLNQAMMELYKKEKINPLGGCLPML